MKVIHIILCFLIFSTGLSQNINFLSVDDGLPQSFVSGIIEDEEGFIWISTRNGLARYDGHEFKVFQHQPYDSISLASNFIDNIRQGKENNLYIRYETEEIDIFNTKTEEITHFLTLSDLQKYAINTDRKNWLITSNNTFWYVDNSNVLYKYAIVESGLEQKREFSFVDDAILDIYENNEGEIWVLTQGFICRYNNNIKQFDKTKAHNTDDIKQSAIYQRANGELMWADNEKLHFFTPKTNSFKSWDLPEKSRHSIKWIKTAPDGKEYFESNKNIYSYDDVNGLQQKVKIPISNQREIRAFLIDQSGLIWVGANTEGLYTVDLATNFTSFYYKENFTTDVFKQQFKFDDNDVFGLGIVERTGLSPGYFLRSFKEQQKIWIALNRSLRYYDFTKEKVVHLPDLPPLDDTEDFRPIRGISITEEGSVIVIDDKSTIYIFDEQSSKWKTSTTTSILQKNKDVSPSNLYVDNDRIWVATENRGLFVLNVLTNNLQVINKKSGLPTNSLFEISADIKDKNILWIGSSQGLIRLDKTNFNLESFSVAQGLPDNMIYSIVPDGQGYLWLGTNKGLCRFHTITHQQRTFTKNHGLTNIEFNRFHSIQLPNGKVAFGGISSGVVFNPKLIQEDKFQPKTVITGIKVNNKDFTDTEDNLTYNAVKTLNLPHTQNTISVEFTALQFSQPEDILYRYRLNGYDKDWVYLDNRREAVYTKIPPGEYVLEINSSNTSGVWSRYTKELGIDISPPFWSTWWARLAFILIVLFATSYFIRHSIKQRVIKEEIVLKQKEAESLKKLDEIKTNFFSNITHEIRTPLSLIIGPAEMLQKGKDAGESKRLVSIIVKNTETLLKLTNQLLDITKLEAGVLKPQMLWGDVVAVVKKMIKSFSEEAASKQITIELNMPKTAEYLFSPNTLERIISNLISNALKFSTLGQKIEVSLFCKDNGVTLGVADYGKGIPESDLPHIFKRFYKADNKGSVPGTGIGLSLVKELVDIHQGFINVESSTQSPSGTTFEVFLPFERKQADITHELKPLENGINEEMFELNSNKKPLVLIVEDNEELASFLSLSLKQSYTTLLAKNGDEGLSIATKEMPDIIISDVMMDGMDGFEFCEILKKDVNLNHIPTILLTAKSDVNSKLKGLSLGADDYITKPFNISELIMRIDNKLELQSYQRNYLYKKLMVLPLSPDTFVSDKENINNEFLDTIQKIIDKRVDDDQFGVEELAKELNMSRASLHRKIKSMTNLAAGEIIKTYRLKKAVTFLNQGYNISETAYKTGFGSPSYFTKCFKETYKITPTEYLQKQALQPNS